MTDAHAAPTTEVSDSPAVARDPHWSATMAKLRAKKPIEHPFSIVVDDNVQVELLDATTALREARWRLDAGGESTSEQIAALRADVDGCEARVAQCEQALEDATVRLTFRALPRPGYERLLAEHPPTDEERSEGRGYYVETFAPALISACSVDGMSVEEATELLETWNQAEAAGLFQAALVVNQAARFRLDRPAG